MKGIPVADTRNFAFMGHTGSGKTTLVDALLFRMGLNDRLGLVAAGSSLADYTDEEKSRKISLMAKPFCGVATLKNGRKLNLAFVDTPGYADFQGHVIAAAHAADAAVFCVDAAAGVQVGALRAWKCCDQRGVKARAIAITGLDKDNTALATALDSIRRAFGDKCVPVTMLNSAKTGVLETLAGAADDPAIAEARAKFNELAAETDDALLEKYLGGESLSEDELARGLVTAVARGGCVPVFCVAALKGVGVAEFIEGVARLLPAPLQKPALDRDGKPINPAADAPFTGHVWRSVNDPFVGHIALVRVLGGTLAADSEIFNATKGQKERVGSLLLLNGKKQESVPNATAGDIVAIPKLKATGMGDALCAPGQTLALPAMRFPKPVAFMAVNGKSQADEDKISTALHRICEDDPTLHVERNKETKEQVLQGMGDVHLDVAVEMMHNRSKVDTVLSTPKVPYRETVTARGEGHHKHKKQTGGRGQYGEVYLRVEPMRDGDEEWFVDAVVGGVIPGNFIPAVQKGLVEGMTRGAVAGYPVTGVKITLYDGSYHDVDSSEIAFKIAGSRALKDGMTKAKPVLLEPVMTVKITVPDQFLGDINGDLNHRRGRIMGMESGEGVQVITAEVPMAELFRYSAELRSITGGQGTFEMDFNRYDVVPANLAQKVIAAATKDKQEEEE